MSSKPVVVLAIATLAVIAWMGLGAIGALSSSAATHLPGAGAAAPAGGLTPIVTSGAGTVTAGPATVPAHSEAALDSQAVAATLAAGLKANVIYLPRASATPAELAQEHQDGVVSSFYSTDPAPMGLAYYGTSGNGEGSYSGGILNTTTVLGLVYTNATGIWGEDLYQSVPDAFSIQLNAVLTNVTLFGQGGYSFWAQAVATYYPATGLMLLVSNVWNFSAVAARMTPNSIFEHGPDGNPDWGTLGYYFSNKTVAYRVSYPFDLELSLTSVLASGRDSVDFGALLTSPTDAFPVTNGTFDYVTFNSTQCCAYRSLVSPTNFTANGLSLNPAGLPDDFELDIVGPGAGSQVDLATADATLGLAYFDGTTFAAVPSAFSYGGDTAETSTGANIAWANGSFTPTVSTILEYGTMTTGPSILTGLWGQGAPDGTLSVEINADPANIFSFFSYLGSGSFTASFSTAFEYAPDIATNTFYLMPGRYEITSLLADHETQSETVLLDAPSLDILTNLYPERDAGVDTPLWAFNNAELAAISQAGTGTATDPYLLDNNQGGPLSSEFGLYNDRGFPVFPGVFLDGTNASVEVNGSFDLLTDTSVAQSPGENLSPTNNLQMWFWNVTNVDLNNSNLSGWFAGLAYYPLSFNSFNVVFYESEHNLVSDNNFLTQGQGLLMYASGQFFGPEHRVGGNNTVWGNDFVQVTPPVGCPDSPCDTYLPYSLGLGAEIGEDFDLVYDNQFDTPTTAWLLPLDLYTGAPATYQGDRWNISTEPASETNFVPNFPTIPLSGSIVGSASQGGNSWWDYGVTKNWANDADNPTAVLPYDENASTLLDPAPGFGLPLPGYTCGTTPPAYYCASYIHPGGDSAPLPTAAAAVDVEPVGTVPGFWGATFSCSPPTNLGAGGGPPTNLGGGGGSSLAGSVCCPTPPTNLGGGGGPPTNLGGGGGPSACDPPARILAQFVTSAPSYELVLPAGQYNVTPYVPPGYTSVAPFTINITAGSTGPVELAYARTSVNVTFSESGLPSGLTWQVAVGGSPESLLTNGGTDSLTFSEPVGTYSYAISDLSGWHQGTLPYTGTLDLNGSTPTVQEPTLEYVSVSYGLTLAEAGLPAGLDWQVTVGGIPESLTTNGATDTLEWPNLANGSYAYSIADLSGWHQATIPYTGTFLVNGAAVAEPTLAYGPVGYSVTFSESGLPTGLTWQVTVDGAAKTLTTNGATDTLTWSGLANGTYAYAIAGNAGWHQGTLPYSGSVVVAGAAAVEPTLAYSAVTYSVTFSESGLPTGLTWTVTVDGLAKTLTTNGGTDSLAWSGLPNGSYAYSVSGNAGWHQSTLPYGGTVLLSGGSVTEPTLVYSAVTYSVYFVEGGLPSGVTWKITVAGVSKSLTVSAAVAELTWTGLANGTYSYAITDIAGWHELPLAYSASFRVNGTSLIGAMVYFQVTYTATLSESGLPSGLTWSATVNGVTKSLTTNGGTDTLSWAGLPNGTYAYSVAGTAGWHQSTLPYKGTLTVNGGTNSIGGSGNGYAKTLVYTQVTYSVTFSETGLPSGLTWSVTVNGVTEHLTTNGGTDTLTFSGLPNGTYAYSIASISGWKQSTLASSGTVVVNGASTVEATLKYVA